MKNLIIIIATMGVLFFISSFLFGKKEQKSCFNAENYQKVYDYVIREKGENKFLTWGDYQIYPRGNKLSFDIKHNLIGGYKPRKRSSVCMDLEL